MRPIPSLSLILACALAFLGGCVAGGSKTVDLEQQIQQQDAQLRRLQPAQADAWNQIQALRQEVNSLRGQLDDIQNAGGARALVTRVKRHDDALRQVESGMALSLNLGDPMAATSAAAAAAPATAAYGQSAAPAQAAPVPTPAYASYGQPAAPAQAAPAPAAPAQTASDPVVAPSASTWGQATPQAAPQVQAPRKDISLALFDAGVNAFQARKYDEAQRSFSDFLKNYKNHSQTAEAQFYLAECYFHRNQFPDAALAYDTVIKKYPASSSAPGAYLKQGICFSKLGQGAAAKTRMQELIKKYPNAPEAARAKTFLKTNK